MTGRLVGVGSVVVDVVATVAELPPRGGDVWASRMRMAAGGGFHALAAAARQGVAVEYAGAHGTGPFGDLARAALRGEGVAVRLAPRPDADTGVVVVLVDGGGERTFVSGRGAETTLGPADLADLAPAAGDVVLVSGYGLDDALAEWVVGLPDAVVVAFDPGPLVRLGPFARARARLDWVSANAGEAAALTGASDPRRRGRAAERPGGRGRADGGAGMRGGGGRGRAAWWCPRCPSTPSTPPARVTSTPAPSWQACCGARRRWRPRAAANAVAARWVATGSYGG